MKQYTVGLQIRSDIPEDQTTIVAENSDEAWQQAEQYYTDRGYTHAALTTIVLFNEKTLS